MRAVEDYKENFKAELKNGKTLDEVLQLAGEMLVVRGIQLRSEKQAVVFQDEIINILQSNESPAKTN